ncbi:proteasome inhibitor PI31 subunit-like [Sitophilus oryzae]|uniref:Proteasome inhibitor PI31 subunit n=1 Tax=Sitophilus oryzae TaxID=7048 RepID=A0A6J2XGK6_SITOR|nr:proteasome inhibitor PI31 subunit-like [Sitophilus oryzae]
MASGLFGWELLYGSVQNDVKTNQDIIICLTHLVLVSNGFKCIGLGESKNIDGSEAKSETLPKGWNQDYAIRYVYQGRLYNLKGTSLDDGIIINLVRVDERTVGSIQLNTRQVVAKSGSLDEMIPDNNNIVNQIKKELIDAVIVSKKTQDNSSQTQSNPTRTRDEDRESPDYLRDFPIPYRYGSQPAVPYGRSDLDPFGVAPLPRIAIPPAGGGMLFNPPRPSLPGNFGIAPGSLPPGARFDPFRPPQGLPNPRGPHRPDNDEFPPPGYDDMFM